MLPKRLVAAFCFELFLCIGFALWIRRVSILNGGVVWSLPAHTLYLYIGTLFTTMVSLTMGAAKLLHLLPGKATIRAGPLGPAQLKRIHERIRMAKRGSAIDIMVDCPDLGSLVSFVEHRRLHWQIRMARARGVSVKFLLLGEPAPISRANPIFNRVENFKAFKSTAQFKQFMRFFPGVSDPTADEFRELMTRYMSGLLEDYDDWGTDVHRLPSEYAKEVRFFLFRIGTKVSYIKLIPDCKRPPAAFETSDRHLVESMTAQFAHLWSIAGGQGHRPPQGTKSGDRNR